MTARQNIVFIGTHIANDGNWSLEASLVLFG